MFVEGTAHSLGIASFAAAPQKAEQMGKWSYSDWGLDCDLLGPGKQQDPPAHAEWHILTPEINSPQPGSSQKKTPCNLLPLR